MPLLALLAIRQRGRDDRRKVALLKVGGSGYAGLTLLLTWQALRGQPVLAPDTLTLLALGALAVAVLVAVALLARPAPARMRA